MHACRKRLHRPSVCSNAKTCPVLVDLLVTVLSGLATIQSPSLIHELTPIFRPLELCHRTLETNTSIFSNP